MSVKTRYRLHATPVVVVTVCVAALIALFAFPNFGKVLADQAAYLPLATMIVASLGPALFLVWYLSCYAEVRKGLLRVRWLWRKQRVDLRRLEHAEVLHGGRGKSLVLLLEDARGRQAWLPLRSWRDEDLLMACVLRATVDRRVRIDGDPGSVQRFSGVLESYKSWDRQLAA